MVQMYVGWILLGTNIATNGKGWYSQQPNIKTQWKNVLMLNITTDRDKQDEMCDPKVESTQGKW